MSMNIWFLLTIIGPGIEDGDEVLASPLTCTASNWPILANNLKIKWVDIDPTTLNMDLEDLERKNDPKNKSHYGGSLGWVSTRFR